MSYAPFTLLLFREHMFDCGVAHGVLFSIADINAQSVGLPFVASSVPRNTRQINAPPPQKVIIQQRPPMSLQLQPAA